MGGGGSTDAECGALSLYSSASPVYKPYGEFFHAANPTCGALIGDALIVGVLSMPRIAGQHFALTTNSLDSPILSVLARLT